MCVEGKAMIDKNKVCVVLPAYNATKTLERTIREIPMNVVDDLILVDDASSDDTTPMGKRLGLATFTHERNKGYGGNQKTCYRLALERGADIVIMLHPDYQYPPKLLLPMAAMLSSRFFDVVPGSRILCRGSLLGGRPFYKYVFNRMLPLIQNLLVGHKLSEYHTGYRAFTRAVLEDLPLERNSDDFVFDNQMLSQVIFRGFRVGEVSCPASYFPEASSINFRRTVNYGLGVLRTSWQSRIGCSGIDARTIRVGMQRRNSEKG